ncbi:MAG: tripartite tricarboxylate transporter TctB family protein [Deltaproteobacteria bacterium]|nr:tripartite tricarboxylate transporter TctB family protein [Deltaproteobacteria bacterium]
MYRNDALGGALIFLFGALTVYLSLKMPLGTFRAAGPGLFPLCLGILLLVLSSIFTLATGLRLRQDERREGKPAEGTGSVKPVLGFMAVIAFAAGFLEHLGYAPTASIVVMALLQILGGSYWRRNLVISLAAGAVSHFLFVRWLQIPFPQGVLGL